jgi:CheY-like chemotaxis protein
MKKTKVAVFEDDVVNRFLYQRSLARQKDAVDFEIFDNPDNGIAYLKENPSDVVIIEAHFWQHFGGISILKKLREFCPPSTVFIAISSLFQDGDVQQLMSAGFTICMEKPVVFSENLFGTRKIVSDTPESHIQ